MALAQLHLSWVDKLDIGSPTSTLTAIQIKCLQRFTHTASANPV